jgi:hypothetical protein
MQLVQILLPTADDAGRAFGPEAYVSLRQELTERFGGVTVFDQGPAAGFWQSDGGVSRDRIMIFEVMCDAVDAEWWRTLRLRLEAEFRQDEVVIRAHEMQRL